MLARMFAQRASQRGDISRQVSLFNGRVGPDELHHLVFAENVPTVSHQDEQNVEDLRRQRHDFPIAQQTPLALVEAKWAELIISGLPEHRRLVQRNSDASV